MGGAGYNTTIRLFGAKRRYVMYAITGATGNIGSKAAVNRPRTAENTTPTAIEEFADTFAAAFEATAMKKAA